MTANIYHQLAYKTIHTSSINRYLIRSWLDDKMCLITDYFTICISTSALILTTLDKEFYSNGALLENVFKIFGASKLKST